MSKPKVLTYKVLKYASVSHDAHQIPTAFQFAGPCRAPRSRRGASTMRGRRYIIFWAAALRAASEQHLFYYLENRFSRFLSIFSNCVDFLLRGASRSFTEPIFSSFLEIFIWKIDFLDFYRFSLILSIFVDFLTRGASRSFAELRGAYFSSFLEI